jgi:hypothetical protein
MILVSTIVSYHDKKGCPVETILPYLFTARRAGVIRSVAKDIQEAGIAYLVSSLLLF